MHNCIIYYNGYNIVQLFTQNEQNNILLITGLNNNIKMNKIKSWFGTIKYIRISPLFPQCIFNIDANKDLLSYATFIEFDNIESAQFIFELLQNRKINENPIKYLKSNQIYFNSKYI